MEEKNKKPHILRTILLVFLVIIVFIAASPFLYSLIGGFNDYDDIPALIETGGVKALSVDRDAVVSFSADKGAVYSYLSRIQPEELLARYSQQPFISDKTVSISRMGYSLSDDSLSASVKLRLFGFIPVQLHMDAEMKLSADEICFRLKDLKYGRWISLPVDEYAAAYGFSRLTDGFTEDLSDFYGELYPVEVSVKDSVISLSCDILNRTAQNVGQQGTLLARSMPLVMGESSDGAKVLGGEGAEVYGKIKDPSSLSALLTELLTFGSEENAAILKPALEEAPFLDLEIGDVSVCSSGHSDRIVSKLREYESGLTTLRDNYKELSYHLGSTGLCSADGSPAESALPEDWGAKIVLQYNQDYNSIVKANDGSLSPAVGWIVLPNPSIYDLERDSGVSVPYVPGISVFDLTVALRLADGTPGILFLSALDQLGINVISEELYSEIVSESLPVYCSSDIVSPKVCNFVTPDDAQRDVVLYLP